MTESVKSYCLDLKHSGGRDIIFQYLSVVEFRPLCINGRQGYFVGHPVVKTPHFQCWGNGFKPWLGRTKIPHAHMPHSKAFFFFNGWQECKDRKKKDPVSRSLPSNRKCKLKDNSCMQKEIRQVF